MTRSKPSSSPAAADADAVAAACVAPPDEGRGDAGAAGEGEGAEGGGATPSSDHAGAGLDDFATNLEKVAEGYCAEGIPPPPSASGDDDDDDADGGADDGEERPSKRASKGGSDGEGATDGATDVAGEGGGGAAKDEGASKGGIDGTNDEGSGAGGDGGDDDGSGGDAEAVAPANDDSDDGEEGDSGEGAGESPEARADDDARATDDADEAQAEEGEDDEEKEELWDLKLLLPPAQILKSNPVPCSTPACPLAACCVWSSTLDAETPWYCCLDCQVSDFGGWPEQREEIPAKEVSEEWREAARERCTNAADPAMPDLPTGATEDAEGSDAEEDGSSSGEAGGGEGEASAEGEEEEDEAPAAKPYESGDEETWELAVIFSAKEIRKSKPIMCMSDHCDLVACSEWKCNVPDEPVWRTCLDCQENDYEGWPAPESGELPVAFLSEEDRQAIAEKCTNQDDPALPDLPTVAPAPAAPSLLATARKEKDGGDRRSSAITPPPGRDRAVADGRAEVVVGAARSKGGGKRKGAPKGGVTPSPMPPKGAASKGAPKGAVVAKPAPPAKKPVLSGKALESHRKWQAEAERMGGPAARIVVDRAGAKKLVFDKLHDDFKPMNINGLYAALKAVVPSIILKGCLDDMVDKFTGNPFDDDDSDDDEPKSKKAKKDKGGASKSGGDEYAGSIKLKEGRNVQNNLYYVDHTKLSNGGNGLLPDKRNELLSDLRGSKAEADALAARLKGVAAEAARLEAEPKNEELVVELTELERTMGSVNDDLEEARAHAANEKYVRAVKKEIENKGAVWRKRKRQCIEFISMMEESTEGTITLKKCLKGDGPIDIDSDEAAIKGAIAFAKRPRARVSLAGRGGTKGKSGEGGGGIAADPNFVGVKLGAQGKPERVFMSEE
ncbi:hypothetical protein ACHAWF_013987 [Thalassiosira exigua]